MTFARHPAINIQRLHIGNERAPLLVVDNLLENPDELVDIAAAKTYGDVASYYPGVRAKVPLTFQKFLLDELRGEFSGLFGLGGPLRFTSCHFSLITTPKERLTYIQRIPHTDSMFGDQLALILYLFKTDLGGTAFYRHRKTGFEVVDEARAPVYLEHVAAQQSEVERTPPAYITGDTTHYERIAHQDGVFNRLLAYRRNSLHCGALNPDFVPVSDPRAGRLSVNGFIA